MQGCFYGAAKVFWQRYQCRLAFGILRSLCPKGSQTYPATNFVQNRSSPYYLEASASVVMPSSSRMRGVQIQENPSYKTGGCCYPIATIPIVLGTQMLNHSGTWGFRGSALALRDAHPKFMRFLPASSETVHPEPSDSNKPDP